MNARFLLAGTAIILLAILPAQAGDTSLPGHSLSTKEATAKAQNVFIGQLVDLKAGRYSMGEFIGKVVYLSRPANGIRGPVATQNTTFREPMIPSDLSFPVAMTVAPGEAVPTVGKSYIFYVKENTHPGESGYEALKLARTTDPGIPLRSL
jgi:hypothetical protein